MNNEIGNKKDKRITFRCNADEYAMLKKDADDTGFSTVSEYIRERSVSKLERIFYDPEMIEEMRAYRRQIRSLVQEVEQIRRHVDDEDVVKKDELDDIKTIVKSIYHKIESAEKTLLHYQKGLIRYGNNQIT